MTNAFVVIVALVGMDVGISLWKQRSRTVDRLVDGLPVVIVEDGRPFHHLMSKARVDEMDVMMAARQTQGLERMDQIKFAVLERSGGISVIPRSSQ